MLSSWMPSGGVAWSTLSDLPQTGADTCEQSQLKLLNSIDDLSNISEVVGDYLTKCSEKPTCMFRLEVLNRAAPSVSIITFGHMLKSAQRFSVDAECQHVDTNLVFQLSSWC